MKIPLSRGEAGIFGEKQAALLLLLNVFKQDWMKRAVQVIVRMTQENFDRSQRAAQKRWPDAVMTSPGMVLAFAKIAARDTLKEGKPMR